MLRPGKQTGFAHNEVLMVVAILAVLTTVSLWVAKWSGLRGWRALIPLGIVLAILVACVIGVNISEYLNRRRRK